MLEGGRLLEGIYHELHTYIHTPAVLCTEWFIINICRMREFLLFFGFYNWGVIIRLLISYGKRALSER